MPDLGYLIAGSSTRILDNNVKGLRITMPEAANAGVTITAWISDTAVGDSFQAVVISDADKSTVIAYSAIRTDISTAGWYTFSGGTLASYAPANGVSIVIAIVSSSGDGALAYYDDAGLDGWTGAGGVGPTLGSPPDMAGTVPMGTDVSRDYSVYLTYTAGGDFLSVNLAEAQMGGSLF